MFKLKFLITLFFFTKIKGNFVKLSLWYKLYVFILGELGKTQTLCPNDTVTFQCTNYGSTFINWELLTTSGDSSLLGINSRRNPEGNIIMDTLGPTKLKYEVISANNSFMRGTVTILDPFYVNGTTIICNDEYSLMLTFQMLGKSNI